RESSTSTASIEGERDALIKTSPDLTTRRRSRLKELSHLRLSSSTESNKLSIARKRSATTTANNPNRLGVAPTHVRRHSWVEDRVAPEDGMPTMGEYFKKILLIFEGMSLDPGSGAGGLYFPGGGSNCVSQQDLNNEIHPSGQSPMEDFSDLDEDSERRPINGESSGLIYSNQDVQNLLGYDVTPLESRKTSLLQSGVQAARSLSNVLFSDQQETARMQYGVDSSFKTRLQQYFVENYKSSFRIRGFNLFIKVLSCILYCIRVVQDDADLIRGGRKSDGATSNITYDSLFWIESDYKIWILQTVVAIISIAETTLLFYISYKGSFIRLLLNVHFLLEMITSFPFIVSIFIPKLRNLYVPVFLNCWLAKSALQAMLNDLNRSMTMVSSALSRQMMSLMSILICLVFTGMCSMEHLMRGGDRPIDLWTSFYFVMVTLSTVGYGDVCPNTWHSQLVIVIIICIVLAVMPSQVEALIQTVIEKQQAGDDLGTFGHSEAHVVVTITHLEVEFIRDFLTEFYAHQENQQILTVLLSPSEMDSQTKMLLRVPLWSQRVFYVRGTALVDEDLERARMSKAVRCFILSARHVKKKNESDQHTVLRSWAVKDFAPNVPQYVQVFRPETKMHLDHAQEVICEDEFKYGLLANNCICPGLSTFLTLLIHTSRGEEGQKSSESWHKVYGFHSGNEIYDILVEDSKFFGDYLGNTFTYASFHAHRAYGVGLLAIKGGQPGARIKLNPGLTHIIQPGDRLYYMALTNEESLYNFKRDLKKQQIKAATTSNIANAGYLDVPDLEGGLEKPEKKRSRNIFIKVYLKSKSKSGNGAESLLLDVAMGGDETARRPSIAAVTEMSHYSSSSDEEDAQCDRCGGECIENLVHRTTPPVKAYIGTSFTVCHMLKKKRELCCLQLDQPCIHNPSPIATQSTWKNPAVILAATRTSSGMYNFIIPLRAYYRPVHELRPIVLLLELEDTAGPANAFLDAISYFPMVYWIEGKISREKQICHCSIDNLLRAGICRAEQVIVVKETAAIAEEHSADCDTIVTVQKIHRMFPRVRLITELTHSSNMRFVQFDPFNPLQQSKFEKKERKRGSNMPFMFRLPFAQGGVFSANMMDRILYQVIVKEFVVDFVRVLLGIDQTPGSGYLTSQLCSKCADVPIGIFRTKKMDAKSVSIDTEDTCQQVNSIMLQNRKKDAEDMVKHRMDLLGLKSEENEVVCVARTETTISYVIINPTTDMQLEEGDIVYVIRAPVKQDVRSRK
ncbi:hypothetical protein PENTCL1PPCAC_27254, partial [Pristionchus entomophagus]